MVLGLAVGMLNRATLPAPDECREISTWAPFLLSASVIAFGFGLVRCLTGPARRIGSIVMIAVSVALVVLPIVATTSVRTLDCG